jgi:hypothetical protein
MYTPWRAIVVCVWLISVACDNESLSSFDNNDINSILSQVNENDESFKVKDVQFDSIVSYEGIRTYRGADQRIKLKLFYFGDLMRGYFNIRDLDDKNLQVFGRNLGQYRAMKCMTTVNMEEAGGYIILEGNNQGIWSTGHINFEKETITLKKTVSDYNDLAN